MRGLRVSSRISIEAAEARNQVIADVSEQEFSPHRVPRDPPRSCATLVVLRSISRPLDDVVAAMAGITAGNLNTPIPAPAPDEIGAMARTLELFRASIIERAQLSAQTKSSAG